MGAQEILARQVELHVEPVLNHSPDALNFEVGVGRFDLIRCAAYQVRTGTAYLFKWMHLEQVCSLLQGKIRYPVQLVQVVLSQSEDEAEGDTGLANSFESRCHRIERAL